MEKELINVEIIYLDVQWKGCTVYFFDDDGQEHFTILLNSKYCIETLKATYIHEISHIRSNDFQNMVSADHLEYYMHNLIQ
ncbi:MAG TPA: hypothetical protein DEP61_07095 [Lachnospiraceae bacterium]|nr:hypothetical protein [Lachnospiraceae bacterium]